MARRPHPHRRSHDGRAPAELPMGPANLQGVVNGISGWYARTIGRWERKLATRDNNRVVRPFDWGLEWLPGDMRDGEPACAMERYVSSAMADSGAFFAYPPVRDYRLDGE